MERIIIITVLLSVLTGCQNHYDNTQYHDKLNYRKLPSVDLTHLIIEDMTLEEKIYQSLIIGFDGTVLTSELAAMAHSKLGGVILFKRNIQTVPQVTALNHQIEQTERDIPLFIGVDQEGGRVNRLPSELGNTESAYHLAGTGDEQLVYNRGRWTGETLKSLNFNLDFSTVLDIWTNPANRVIGDRSFGTTAEQVTQMAGKFNQGIMDAGIVTSGKHFPGHGDTFVDSHESLPVSNHGMDRLTAVELRPFAALKDELDMIMVSHIQLQQLDSLPSSLSEVIVTDLLRHDMNYDGVIVTDDLSMGAIAKSYSQLDAVKRALLAGNTMVLIGSDTQHIPYIVEEIKKSVRQGLIKEEKLDKNIEKILRLKLKYGIL